MPFRLQVPPEEAVEHRAWRHAHMAVLDAIERGEAVAVLGPPGSGKTLLLRSLARALAALGWKVALVGAEGLGAVPDEAELVLLDEAGQLSPADLVALARRESPFVLAAPPGFAARLTALERRVAWVTLGPMAPEEVARLVAARLAAAGLPPDLFTPEALQALARHSGGMVRLVLVLAGAALFAAQSAGAPRVTHEDVEEAAAMRTGVLEAAGPVEVETPVAEPARAGPEPRLRLANAAPRRARESRMRMWSRRITLGLAAAGLAVAAGAVVVVPHVLQRRVAPEVVVVAPPAVTPPAEPPAVVEPPVAEPPVPLPDPVPPPVVVVVPPPAPARPVRPRVATIPAPTPAVPLPETPVEPSPWSVGRSPAPVEAAGRLARVVMREPANIRRAPGIASPVVRVTSAGMVLRVFDQRGPWVLVGDSAPWGWVHSDVVERAS